MLEVLRLVRHLAEPRLTRMPPLTPKRSAALQDVGDGISYQELSDNDIESGIEV